MWVCLVEMRARPGHHEALVRLCEDWMAEAPAKGCNTAEMLLDDEEPALVILLEHWESRERFEANAARELADADLMARFGAVIAGPPRIRQLRPSRTS